MSADETPKPVDPRPPCDICGGEHGSGSHDSGGPDSGHDGGVGGSAPKYAENIVVVKGDDDKSRD